MIRRILAITGTALVVLALFTFLAYKLTPWPTAMLIRYYFNKEGLKVNDALLKHVPAGVSSLLDQSYIEGDKDARLDVYCPEAIANTDQRLPVVVWVHGGGWISGSKAQVANYCKILASKGYTVVAIDYSLAPEKHYPLPLQQTNRALEYINENAGRFHVDTNHFILAGDSGGAHIAAQTANIISSAGYADLIGVKPGINRKQLTGLILYCGAYDAGQIDLNGSSGIFLKTVLWSYSGEKDFVNAPLFKPASVINYITKDYPACFISVGNGDPLLSHSLALAKKLTELKVPLDSLFFKSDHKPVLPHEYQFNLDEAAGKLALDRSVKFLERVSR
ncbi:MAG: alpha/beta hydrolase [Candidatus Pedobacter colombiensis]|uniref:Alpha/beta hydrolase n=1 Tax=Candidatus Pedobacter colombiensis TaxID=3121371 RepID=A0AAJ6B5P5_9SPHI|nr:alpha/beta hydrolase [Pedobacter sp.]WEK18977.1 MAG: alpha/beta hydrolase [Pedobacter sp.]